MQTRFNYVPDDLLRRVLHATEQSLRSGNDSPGRFLEAGAGLEDNFQAFKFVAQDNIGFRPHNH
jgi:hypothetical protein